MVVIPLDGGSSATPPSDSVAIALGVRRAAAGPRASRGSASLARRLGVDVPALALREHAGTSAGDLTRIPSADAGQLWLVGVGDGTPSDLRVAAASLARGVRHAATLVTTLGAGSGAGSATGLEAVAEGIVLGAYRAPREGLKAAEDKLTLTRVELAVGPATGPAAPAAVEAVRRGLATARATTLARDLANTRSSTKGPSWLAARARTVATAAGLPVKVWSEADLAAEGFGALLAVGAAAERGPRLVQISYTPEPTAGRASPAHVVLAGKGITFDTGGISLKPRESMLGMTTDMTGAAVVLAVLAACRELAVPVRVTGLMALAENGLGAAAYRPGDVVTTYDGTTVEIRNTDAEGRLVLADAMGYARTRLRPDVLVDVATLTGAATMALGRGRAALYTTDAALGRALERAGEASGELTWPMPLVADYRPLIDSDLADVCQISTRASVGAGSIMAALFLREFAGDVPWAHLDIAGPGRSERDHGEISRGGTGFGARLLLSWLQGF